MESTASSYRAPRFHRPLRQLHPWQFSSPPAPRKPTARHAQLLIHIAQEANCGVNPLLKGRGRQLSVSHELIL